MKLEFVDFILDGFEEVDCRTANKFFFNAPRTNLLKENIWVSLAHNCILLFDYEKLSEFQPALVGKIFIEHNKLIFNNWIRYPNLLNEIPEAFRNFALSYENW